MQLVFMVSRGERLAIPPADQLPGVDQVRGCCWCYMLFFVQGDP